MEKIRIEAHEGGALSDDQVHNAFDRYLDAILRSVKNILLLSLTIIRASPETEA